MDIILVYNGIGFKFANDEDYEKKAKLKVGETYKVTIKRSRNLQFHRKYFKMISVCFDLLTEEQRSYFKNNSEIFRTSIQMSVGICDRIYLPSKNEWVDIPKSIAFDKMTEEEFEDLYAKVRRAIIQICLPNVTSKEIEDYILHF